MSQAPARSPRARLIGAIHAAAARLGMDEDARRALQRDCVGKESCAGMTENELRRVLGRISPDPRQNTGPRRNAAPQGRLGASRPVPRPDKAAMVRKIYALLADAGRPVAYAESMLRHMFGEKAPDALEWAAPDQLWRLVAALEIDKNRRNKK